MKIIKICESNEHDKQITSAAIDSMEASFDDQTSAFVGPFWYDPNKNELYGTSLVLASDVPFYKSSITGNDVRTARLLHKQIWDKESRRIPRNPRFSGDYRLKPRGRVFEVKDEGYRIYVGNWINNYPQAIDLIMYEFQLPENNTNVYIDSHWDLGHGWSKEF